MKQLTRTREIIKGRSEERNAGVINRNPPFYNERALQGEKG